MHPYIAGKEQIELNIESKLATLSSLHFKSDGRAFDMKVTRGLEYWIIFIRVALNTGTTIKCVKNPSYYIGLAPDAMDCQLM